MWSWLSLMFLMACSKHKAEQSPLQEISFSPSLEEKFCNTPDFLHHLHRPTFCTGVLLGGDVYVTHTPATDWPIYKQNSLSEVMLCLGNQVVHQCQLLACKLALIGTTVWAAKPQETSQWERQGTWPTPRQLASPTGLSLSQLLLHAAAAACSLCWHLTLISVLSGQKEYSTPPGWYTSRLHSFPRMSYWFTSSLG